MRAGPTKQRRGCVQREPGLLRSQSGQSLLEVALMLPMLMLLLLGAIEMGRYMYIYILVGNAARAGAAYGSEGVVQAGTNDPGVQTAAQNDFQNGGQAPGTVTVTWTNVCGCDSGGTLSPNPPTAPYCNVPPTGSNSTAGSCTAPAHWVVMVSVTASGTFQSLFNYPGIPSSITISRTATMRVALPVGS
jgi:Flp pilus assembly protein TadG